MLTSMYFLRSTSALIAILAGVVLADRHALTGEFPHAPNDFSHALYSARLWVDYDRLPRPDDPQIAPDQMQFKKAWEELGLASSRVVASWNDAFAKDPLLKRAMKCVDRSYDLDQFQANVLRRGLREQYGFAGFNELDSQGHEWLATDGNPWLDLEDTELVRLVLWWGEFVHSRQLQQAGKEPAAPYEWLIEPSDWLSEWSEQVYRLNPEDLHPSEVLTEQRAIELFRLGVDRKRRLVRQRHAELTARLDLPQAFFEYWRRRREHFALHEFGYDYLQITLPKCKEIAQAEAEYAAASEAVTALRPNAFMTLHLLYRDALLERDKKLEDQRMEIDAILSKGFKAGDPKRK